MTASPCGIGRYGGTTDRRRIEALAAINENPQARAADIRLVELVFCGASQRNDGGLTLDDVVFRPAFAHDAQTVESLDLFDALVVRDTCHLPARFWSMLALSGGVEVIGRALVVDLGFDSPSLPFPLKRASLDVAHTMVLSGLALTNRLYESARAVDPTGHLATGYALALAHYLLRAPPPNMQGIPNLDVPLHEFIAYNTPLYHAHVQALLHNQQDKSAEKLGSLLGLPDLFSQCNTHGCRFIKLDALKQHVTNSIQTDGCGGTNVAVVDGNGHHFLVAWALPTHGVRGSTGRWGSPVDDTETGCY